MKNFKLAEPALGRANGKELLWKPKTKVKSVEKSHTLIFLKSIVFSHPGFRVYLKFNDSCLYKRKERDIWAHREIGKKALKRQRQKSELCCHKPRTTRSPQKLEEERKAPP